MPKTRLSACLVLYHSGEKVLKTLDCLDKCPLPITTYVVDNSPAEDLAERIHWSFPGVKILPQKKNLGFGRANNIVLDELTSDYHLLINPDITFEPDLLPRMIDYMDNHSNVVVLTPKVLNSDGTVQHLPKQQPTVRYLLAGRLGRFSKRFQEYRDEYTMANQRANKPKRVSFATGCFLLIRTSAFQKLHGFDERFFLYHEDSDLSKRIVEASTGPIIYHPDMVVTHDWQRESAHSLKGLALHVISTVKYFMKWGLKW